MEKKMQEMLELAVSRYVDALTAEELEDYVSDDLYSYYLNEASSEETQDFINGMQVEMDSEDKPQDKRGFDEYGNYGENNPLV